MIKSAMLHSIVLYFICFEKIVFLDMLLVGNIFYFMRGLDVLLTDYSTQT